MGNIISTIITISATAASFITLYLFCQDDLDKFLLRLRGGVPKGFIIFITGTNGVGKTTIAERLGKKLGISSILEVNDLREVLRSRPDLFAGSGREDEYNQLLVSSYLSDSIHFSDNSSTYGSYKHQCEIMTPTILAAVLRKQKHNTSSIIEGINIMPSELIKQELPAKYALFVNLQIESTVISGR